MAEIVDQMPSNRGRKPKYPWQAWANGAVWKISKGVDFTCSFAVIRAAIHSTAARKGVSVRTSRVGNDVYFQFIDTSSGR